MIKWTEEAIDAAWMAFWGAHHQIEKADMVAALNAALIAQGITNYKTTRVAFESGYNEAIKNAIQEIKELKYE